MTELSEIYIALRGEVQGKRRLDSSVVNPLLQTYRKLLESFRINEKKDDGGIFQVGTQEVDEFNSELLSDKILIFSHKLKLNVRDTYPHGFDNYMHRIQVKISKGLGKIRVENGETYTRKISIITTGIKFSGGGKTSGRWPEERMAGIGI